VGIATTGFRYPGGIPRLRRVTILVRSSASSRSNSISKDNAIVMDRKLHVEWPAQRLRGGRSGSRLEIRSLYSFQARKAKYLYLLHVYISIGIIGSFDFVSLLLRASIWCGWLEANMSSHGRNKSTRPICFCYFHILRKRYLTWIKSQKKKNQSSLSARPASAPSPSRLQFNLLAIESGMHKKLRVPRIATRPPAE
jgi:hypothetical protein